MVAKKKATGKIPIMDDEYKNKVLANLEKNRTWGGMGSTKTEAEQIAKDLKTKGYQTIITKMGEHAWFVEKSKVNFKEL